MRSAPSSPRILVLKRGGSLRAIARAAPTSALAPSSSAVSGNWPLSTCFGFSACRRSRSADEASPVAVRRGALSSDVASRRAPPPKSFLARASSGNGALVAEIAEQRDGGEPEPVLGQRFADQGTGAPPGEQTGGGDVLAVTGRVAGAVGGEHERVGFGKAAGAVVIEQKRGDAGQERLGTNAEVSDDQGCRRVALEPVEDVRVPGGFVLEAGLSGDIYKAG